MNICGILSILIKITPHADLITLNYQLYAE
jgi:hypothetical protein